SSIAGVPVTPGSHAGLRALGGWRLDIVAHPGDHQPIFELRAGDLVVRAARGEGWGTIAVVATPSLRAYDELGGDHLRPETGGLPMRGNYAHVVEVRRGRLGVDEHLARRITDARGMVLADTLVLRPSPPDRAFAETEALCPARRGLE